MTAAIRVASRRSPLAMAQARQIADAVTELTGRATELVPVTTVGDTATGPLTTIGGSGVFVGAVRDALLAGQADVGVHSLKDLPTAPAEEFVIAAIPTRADPRDALCSAQSRRLVDLPANSRVGTGSPRRAAQLRIVRPDLEILEIRGNVATRLRKVDSGELAAVILAAAGLRRLGLHDRITETLSPDVMLPAPGQGALAVETSGRLAASDSQLDQALKVIDDIETHACVIAERAVLSTLQAGCLAPVGALATVNSDNATEMKLEAVVVAVDGSQEIRMSDTGSVLQAAELGRQLAQGLLAAGAAGLLGESR
jgi:hydroxymethylbilane synthase